MLNIKLHVSSINYAATFHTLYPLLAGHFTKADGQNLLKSLIVALGDDAEKVFVSWLPYLEETERRQLIAGIVSQNSPRLTALLNEKLQSNDIGKCIRAGSIKAYLAESDFILELDDINAKIPALVDEVSKRKSLPPYIVTGIKGLSLFAPRYVEKKGVEYINAPEIRSEILKTLQDTLNAKGIAVSVEEIVIRQLPGGQMPLEAGEGSGKLLDEASEKIIVDALVRYLIDNAGRNGGTA